MAAVVDVWVGELTKLREKVRVKKSSMLKTRRSSESAAEDQEQEETKIPIGKSSAAVLKSPVEAKSTETTLTESTIFLLMDRFAPS